MQVDPEISFHGVDHSDAVEQYIRERIERLDRLSDEIIACRVVVERPHAHHNPSEHSGNRYRSRVEVTLPGDHELIGDKERGDDPHLRVHTVVKEAFEAVERQLKEASERRRNEVKTHNGGPRPTR